ncbi:MAG: hypothetical protein AB7T27_03175 [Kiritimatiellia bacterium]
MGGCTGKRQKTSKNGIFGDFWAKNDEKRQKMMKNGQKMAKNHEII